MPIKRRYSDDEKATALAALDANHGNVKMTAGQLGIPKQTLEDWSNERGVHGAVTDLRNEKKITLEAALGALALRVIDVLDSKIDNAPVKEVNITLGITLDKIIALRASSKEPIAPGDDPDDAGLAALLDTIPHTAPESTGHATADNVGAIAGAADISV